MSCIELDLFNLFQSMIAFVAPPIATVFLLGVLWKRATGAAALSTFVLGYLVCLPVGGCYFGKWPYEGFWPHYMLLSFHLFVRLSLFMILVSLLTRHSHDERSLPTLKETYARQGKQPTFVWMLWGVLAMAMLGLYILFD
jgi:SSS family solute:Na+ symporter